MENENISRKGAKFFAGRVVGVQSFSFVRLHKAEALYSNRQNQIDRVLAFLVPFRVLELLAMRFSSWRLWKT